MASEAGKREAGKGRKVGQSLEMCLVKQGRTFEDDHHPDILPSPISALWIYERDI